jgi:6-phospho-3-hexuloisomerase
MPRKTRLELVVDEVISHLRKVERNVKRPEVDQIIADIDSANQIFVYGAGRSGYVARSFAQRLMQIGYRAFFVGETISPAGGRGDLLIAVSGSGGTPSVVSVVRTARRLGLRVDVVSSNRAGTAVKASDSRLIIPGKTKLLEWETYAPFTSLFDIAALTVLDGITAELMKKGDMTDEDIGRTHANLE